MTLRELEVATIKMFLRENASEHFAGRSVLDYGCGKQPYRELIEEAGGAYQGYDRPSFPGSVVGEIFEVETLRFDTVICTQVIQYVKYTDQFLLHLHSYLRINGGWLLMTGPTNWPHIEVDDLFRFTTSGIKDLLGRCYEEIEVGYRAHVEFEGESWPIGWWAKARVEALEEYE